MQLKIGTFKEYKPGMFRFSLSRTDVRNLALYLKDNDYIVLWGKNEKTYKGTHQFVIGDSYDRKNGQ